MREEDPAGRFGEDEEPPCGAPPCQGEEKHAPAGALRPVPLWAGVLAAGAILLFLLAGGLENLRPVPESVSIDEDAPIPVIEDPIGQVPTPPTRFHWTSRGSEVDFAQVLLFRADLERFWASGPISGGEVEVPLSAYEGIPAGEQLYWRVREVSRGKPQGVSDLVSFSFEIDSRGYRQGEAPTLYDFVK